MGIILLAIAYKFYQAPADNEVRDDHVTDTAMDKPSKWYFLFI